MRVAIHKARHDHTSVGGDFVSVSGCCEILYATPRPDFLDEAIHDQNRPILNQTKFSQSGAATGTAGTAQGEQLPGPSYEGRLPHSGIDSPARSVRTR